MTAIFLIEGLWLGRPVTCRFEDGELVCSNPRFQRLLAMRAATGKPVAVTWTGPFLRPDLGDPRVAYLLTRAELDSIIAQHGEPDFPELAVPAGAVA
jgi:hypothetical protein